MNRGLPVEVTPPECALAAEMFDHFCAAGTMKQILALHREICNTLNLRPNRLPDFYPKLKAKLASSWKALALFKKFDLRANHKVYAKGRVCTQNKVLIIGAGPCGLRAAIECQLLGAKVVVVEKRDRMSRNNVLHLWPFVIQDLRALGAKKFFGKFCAGSINHICIRQLQCILLKVALLLGVEFHEGVSFEELLEPSASDKSETLGWRARVTPATHPVSQYEFDALIGADGKRNTLHGFKRKEFRGKLAMAITANFINRHSEQEAAVQEISGVAFIFHQKFFKELYEVTGIDLENIVYYKDDTHYFVMTAKKHSLLDKGVLLKDFNEVSRLLSVENVDRAALMRYAQEAARFSTEGRLPLRDFALNHYGEPDVALFDFTSMYAAENASMVYERHGRRLLCQLVGDSLLEPFWPTGSGCARGFLSALDAAWAIRAWGQSPMPHPLHVIAERESIYRLLAQTTPENLHRDFGAYTLDPGTRYPNLNRVAVTPHRVTSFYDSDEPLPLDATTTPRKRRREAEVSDETLIAWVGSTEGGMRAAASAQSLSDAVRRYRPDLLPEGTPPRGIYHILHHEMGISPVSASGTVRDVPDAKLRSYLSRVYNAFKGEVPHVYHETDVFDQIKLSMQKEKHVRNSSDLPISAYAIAVDAEKSPSSYKRKRRSLRTAQEEGRIVGGGSRAVGRGVRVAKLAAELSGSNSNASCPKPSKPKDLMRSVGKIERDDWNMKEIERKILENKLGRPEPKTAERVPKWDREQFLVRQRKLKEGEANDEKWGEIDETLHKLDQKLRDSGRPDHGTNKVASLATKFVNEPDPPKAHSKEEVKKSWRGPATAGVQCAACGTRVFAAEGVTADGLQLHRACFRCAVCKAVLRPGNYTMERNGVRLVCLRHSGVTVPDAVLPTTAPQRNPPLTLTPERISLEISDSGAKEIDEDEWTDRNCLASETSCAGGLSDEEESSSDEYTDAGDSYKEGRASPVPEGEAPPRHHHNDMYISDDSFGYDDYSDDGAESSGNESCSRMREAREARRREVPADARPSSYSSEVESEEESESSDEVSSATEVSTDSEFAREESAPPPAPPAILVTEPPPPPAPHAAPQPQHTTQDYPLSRTRSAGGLATKRALELKRKYLLGEPSPPAVRKSDSTSQIDTKFEAFRSNITEFQKMLNPAGSPAQQPIVSFRFSTEDNRVQPMPDIIKNLCTDAPVDLLKKTDSSLLTGYISEKSEPVSEEKVNEPDLDSDSLSEEDSSQETAPKSVPRLEVHDEGGELIQLDSLMIVNSSTEEQERAASGTGTATGPTVLAAESESSESGRDATTLALTETELSDWAAEANVLDECDFHESKPKKRSKNPRALSGPKLVHDAKNIAAVVSHVCGRTSPPTEHIGYNNALEHFEFADEGDQDPSIETPSTPKNEGYMELVDDEFEYSPGNDRSMNFIERSFSETVVRPTCQLNSHVEIVHTIPKEIQETYTESEVQSPQGAEIESSDKSISENKNTDRNSDSKTISKVSDGKTESKVQSNSLEPSIESLSITEVSPQSKSQPLFTKTTTESETLDDISPPLVPDTPTSKSNSILSSPLPFSGAVSMRLYSPAICRSASETFNRSRSTDSPTRSFELSHSVMLSSGSVSPVSPFPSRETTDKVQEIKRERDEQTEVVRRLVLERLGGGSGRAGRRSKRTRLPPSGAHPPPIPPPPVLPDPPTPPPPPRPAPPLLPMPVTPSFSDPELARERRRKSIMKSISNYLNRHLGPRHKWASEPNLTSHEPAARAVTNAHKSTGAIHEPAPPVPPPPACYSPPSATKHRPPPTRLPAEQQAATVAELVQVSAQREAHQALIKADKRRNAASSCE